MDDVAVVRALLFVAGCALYVAFPAWYALGFRRLRNRGRVLVFAVALAAYWTGLARLWHLWGLGLPRGL